MDCQYCGRKIMVKPADYARGEIVCSHVGCGYMNILTSSVYFDEAIVNGLPEFGRLVYTGKADVRYPLRFGQNVIGTSEGCPVRVERYLHNGRCFISRRHCTLTVTFDKWSGQLRYHVQDGAVDPGTNTFRNSLNGTFLNQLLLQPTEIIDVPDGGVITLGGVDAFQLTHAVISPVMLDSYKIRAAYNPDSTQ